MRPLLFILMTFAATATSRADEAADAVAAARNALKAGDSAAALSAAEKAVALAPKSPVAYFVRGDAYAAARKHAEAIRDFDKSYSLDKTFLLAIDHRGGERFKLGQVKESIADFDVFLKDNPREAPAHWRRGISYYYVGQYEKGAKQFFDGQDAFSDDVENAFWHYLCNARKDGVATARKSILKLSAADSRVPLMSVYDLIQGKVKAKDVIDAAEMAKLNAADKNQAQFYAHLYVALNYEAEGDAAKCLEHLKHAVEHKIGHYMWDVANVHLNLVSVKKK